MGYSWTFPISVDGYLFQLNSQKPWSDLFSSFSFTSSANTVNPYLQINSESRPLSPPWLLTTPEQATVVSHQDTCCHLLPGLCASSSLLWSTLDSTYEWPMPHCSSVENPLLPISLQKTSLQLCTHPGNSSLCPHCFLFSHLTQTAPVTPDPWTSGMPQNLCTYCLLCQECSAPYPIPVGSLCSNIPS